MEKYYLTKISNFKDIRNHLFTILLTLNAGLASVFLSQAVTAKIVIIAIFGGIIDFGIIMYYFHINKLINKYTEKLK